MLFRSINAYPIEETLSLLKADIDYTPLTDINPAFTDAVVAIEDHRFYKHGAVDFISLARATFANLEAGEIKQGGSTITQQLAKNLFLDGTQNMERKITEMFLAYHLENSYSKNETLEFYVNAIYYGDGFTGIGEASQGYFNKTPDALTFEEATLLAGLPQAPSYFALSTNYEGALRRQSDVIEALIEYDASYQEMSAFVELE